MKKTKNNVLVAFEIFNEEHRIESMLENFSWAEELVIFDKSSTDNTAEIARKYTNNVIKIPYSDTTDLALDLLQQFKTSCDWYFFPTASSLISPKLVKKLTELTSDPSFKCRVIGLPLRMYVLGICDKKSPWDWGFKEVVIHKDVLKLSKKVHSEIGYTKTDVLHLTPPEPDAYYYHCTHETMEELFLKHIRYTKNEFKVGTDMHKHKLSTQGWGILKAIYHVTLRRKSILMGSDGISLSLAYISYFLMRYLFLWEQKRTGYVGYEKLRESSIADWRAEKLKEISQGEHL
jgi:glycosyltransferase involved in cell wall biosynthesis